jgi:hypothetical protein
MLSCRNIILPALSVCQLQVVVLKRLFNDSVMPRESGPPSRLPPLKATALALPAGKATAGAAPLRFGLARGSWRARFRQPGGRPRVGPQEDQMISVYGTTFAYVSEIARRMLVRRLAGFHVVVDIKAVEDTGTRLWLSDGSTITLGAEGLVEVAR